ncbi:hypothetical protein ASZ78_010371, partial [Callipepla squamata]
MALLAFTNSKAGFELFSTYRANWKPDGSDRSPVQSLEITGSNCEDEDMDLSDADREAESSSQSNEKQGESFSTNAIYAVPCKNKKEELQPSPSNNGEKKDTSHETQFQVLVDESNVESKDLLSFNREQTAWLEFKVCLRWDNSEQIVSFLLFPCQEEKLLAVSLIREKPPPSPDVSIRARQARENMTKEKLRELQQENWSLNKAYQAVGQELEGIKQQMEKQQLKLKRLEEQNRKLKEAAKMTHNEGETTELHSLRQQAQELVDENDALKLTVHRLNVELSRYQTKFRPLTQEEHLKLNGLPSKGPPPPWLLDMKYLSPLLLAYEDRIKEKEDLSFAYEASVVVSFLPQASKLTKQIVILEEKKQSQEEQIEGYQKQLKALHTTCEELKAKLDSRIAAEEHFALVNDLKRYETAYGTKETVLQNIHMYKSLCACIILRLKKKIGLLKQQLEEATEKEVVAHHYLTNLIGLVEKIAQERDHLIFLAKCLENENHGVLNKIVEGSLRLGRLEEKVKLYKKRAAGKLGDISLKMTEQEKDFAGKTARYQEKMKHLQRLLQDKQETLDEVLLQKKSVRGRNNLDRSDREGVGAVNCRKQQACFPSEPI